MHFYSGRVLRIDLTAGSAVVEPLNATWAEKYIGGKGLLLRYMWDEVPPHVDPWSPDNPIILMTGPFAGTGVSTGSRMYVGSKSPATGILNDSCIGGSFGPELKFAGYDAVIIMGRAPNLTVVVIRDDVVEFRSAAAYAGMKTSAIEEAMRRDFDPETKTLSIGPAGESEVPWACISTDHYHKAGRGGHGALMGHKNLKAVAVRGTGAVTVGDARAFLSLLYEMHEDHILTGDNLWAHEEGTPILVDPVNGGGALPTRNWSASTFEGADGINSSAFQKIRVKKRACYQCALGCRNFHATTYRGAEVRGEGPEYETIALCGANCGIDDIDALVKFNAECDEWGLDTVTSGAIVGLAMDMSEKGIKDFGLRFGDGASYVQVPGLVARREGIGEELALGTRALAVKYGCPELAMQVKGLELPGYDPRGSFGMSIAYATSDRGGCHLRAYPAGPEVLSGSLPPDSLAGKAGFCIEKQHFNAVKFSAVFCDFWAISPQQLCVLFERLQRRSFSEQELLDIGERVWNLGRLFNLREGVESDRVPALLCEATESSLGVARKSIGSDALHAAIQEYYELRGWNEEGVPTEEKLAAIGVDVRLPDRPV